MRIVALALAGWLLAACGTSGSGESPEAAVDAMLEAIENEDCELMREVTVESPDFDCALMSGYTALMGGLDSGEAEIVEKSRAGTSAVVAVTWPSGSSDFEVELVQGSWRVLLDSAA